MPSLKIAFAPAPRSWRNRPPDFSKASSAAASRSPPARWVPGIGTGSTATGCGTKGNTGSSASIRKALSVTPASVQALLHPDDIDELRKAMAAVQQGREILRGGVSHHPAGRRSSLVRRHGGRDRRQGRPRHTRQRRHRRHHRTEAGGRTAESAGPGGRSPRQECAGAGAIDRSADARRKRQGLHPGGGRADQCAGAGAYHPLFVELAGRGNRKAGRRRTRALLHRRPDRIQRFEHSAATRNRANAGAGPARTRHQFGQVWRPVDAVRPPLDQMGDRGRISFGWCGKSGMARLSRSRHRADSEPEA